MRRSCNDCKEKNGAEGFSESEKGKSIGGSTLEEERRINNARSAADMAILSIGVRCANHPRLKRFVEDGGATGYECGICHPKDVLASAPAKYEVLCSLIRALVDSITMNGCTTDIGATIKSRNLCLATPHIAVERTFGQTLGFSGHECESFVSWPTI